MPSRFPGMDPFLEHPKYFPGLHSSLIFVIYEDLQKALPEPYFAVLNERLWLETSGRIIEPDVDVMRAEKVAKKATKGDSGGLALLTRSKPVRIPVDHDGSRETFLEIRILDEDEERVVTTIEILSPSNKAPGTKRRDRYVAKQAEILDSNTNLVEIDLLRGGLHTTAVPLARLQREVGLFAYHVCVYVSHTDFFVYPIRLEDTLPEIAVPLLPQARAVAVDLQAVFDRCYDAGPYKRRVKYDIGRLAPPLSGKEARWVKQQLRQAK